MDRLKDEKFAEFYKKYLEAIADNYEELERARLSILYDYKRYRFEYILSGVILSFISAVFILLSVKEESFVKIYFFICSVLLFYITTSLFLFTFNFLKNKHEEKFKKYLKESLIDKLLQTDTNIIRKSKKYKLENNLIKASNLFGYFENDFRDDEFEGIINNVPTSAIEIKLCKQLGDNPYPCTDSNYYNNVFSGIIFKFKYNKKIKEQVLVFSKPKLLNIIQEKITSINFIVKTVIMVAISICAIGGILYCKNKGEILFYLLMTVPLFVIFFYEKNVNINKNMFKPIILEDSKFNKKFNVYSSDQVEARYLVTPLFMEKFYNLKTAFGAKNIRCSFFDDNLMIAIDTKRDLFELGNLFKPVRDIKTIERFYDEITTIFDLIDYFKLNEDIYLK